VPRFTGFCDSHSRKPNSVLMTAIYLVCLLPDRSILKLEPTLRQAQGNFFVKEISGTPLPSLYKLGRDTALHTGKNLAVSAGLNRVVSARTSTPLSGAAGVTRYHPKFDWCVFGLSSP